MSSNILTLLDEDTAQPYLRPLDRALARFLAERDAHAPPVLLLLAALLSRQLADGHLCMDLALLSGMAEEQNWPPAWRNLLQTWRDPDDLRAMRSPLLADGHDGAPAAAPLVLDGTRLYLRRYWNHERDVAQGVATRLARETNLLAGLAIELDHLFPPPFRSGFSRDAVAAEDRGGIAAEAAPATAKVGRTPVDWPRIACALAARGAFSVITGGPGTGKTTTVVRLLGLLQTLQMREQKRPLRIRLAAPTGKAAARLNTSIADQLARLDVDDTVRAAIPAQVDTLHRLLGARPDTRRFRHDRSNPLHLDVLVIDEASMIDLEMMAAVLAALPVQARLVLLGDKDQLSSVEAGAVLGDLCRRAESGHYNRATANWLRDAGCGDIDAFTSDDAQPLDQQITMLRHSHRFAADSGIGQLARAVNGGDVKTVRALLNAQYDDITWTPEHAHIIALAIEGRFQPINDAKLPALHKHRPDALARHSGAGRNPVAVRPGQAWSLLDPGLRRDDDVSDDAPHGYRHYLELLQRERPTADANDETFAAWAHHILQAHGHFQLLCALRNGPFGTQTLNQRIAEALHATGLIDADHGWYEGRPVMVLRNDYTLGLMNGDVGIALRRPDRDGNMRLYVAFPDNAADGANAVHFILPSRLEETDTVYAMTVHKSQGSEFDHTALLLPDQATVVLTRELLYTGITRARRHFSLVAPPASIELAVGQRTRRHSGLDERLRSPQKPANTP
jgi:exodeoxyribonuclease V alpha subunit